MIRDHVQLIEILLGTAIALAPMSIVVNRVLTKKGLGVRSIQFLAVSTIVPSLILLAMRGLMQGETVAAILSATIGYLLAQISKFDERE